MLACDWCGFTTGHAPACLGDRAAGAPAVPDEGVDDGACVSDASFAAFHRDNPQVYRRLVALARQGVAAGRMHLGIKMLWEVLRWHSLLETSDPDFKLNNNYHSRYARLVMAQEPDLAGVFETRDLRT